MAAGALGGLLAGCDGKPAPASSPAPKGEAPDIGYVPAPSVEAASPAPGGVRLEGRAPPGARVRLAPPSGAPFLTTANRAGRWRIVLPPAADARIFGLSRTAEGRQVQAQGYVLVTPSGRAAMLRAGAGAVVLAPLDPPRLAAVDFDRQGGAVVSGLAGPEAAISIRVDGRPGAVGRADPSGRFSLALPQPLALGPHRIEVVGDAFTDGAAVNAAPAEPLSGAAFRATENPEGLRADWMTPGGGVQSTWILN